MISLTLIFYFLWVIFLIRIINSDYGSAGDIAGCLLFLIMFFMMFAHTIESVQAKKTTQHNNYTGCMRANSIDVVSYRNADERIKNIKKLCNATYSN